MLLDDAWIVMRHCSLHYKLEIIKKAKKAEIFLWHVPEYGNLPPVTKGGATTSFVATSELYNYNPLPNCAWRRTLYYDDVAADVRQYKVCYYEDL